MSEVDELLKPISEASPAGVDLRAEATDLVLGQLRELRSELDPALDPDGRGREADWSGVARECEQVLRTRSKDLELAAWLAEAWGRLEGFGGLERGLDLVCGLVASFWDDLHPGRDEDGVTLPIRARALAWLGSSQDFQRSVKNMPIVEAPGLRVLCWADYEVAQQLDEPTLGDERRRELVDGGAITAEQWSAALGSASGETLATMRAHLEHCQAKLDVLDAACEQLFADDDPPELHRLRRLLVDIAEHLAEHEATAAGGIAAPADAVAATGAAAAVLAAPAAGATPVAAGPIASRQEALQRLREVAEFFRRTEPHSPLSDLIARAVRWGDMHFADVLRDLARDDDFLGKIWETLGIEPDTSSSDD